MSAQPSKGARILKPVLLFGLLAGLLSCLVGYGLAFQWFIGWKTLPPLPTPGELAGATVNSVDVQTADGTIYRYNFLFDELAWQPVDAPLTETDEGCEPFDRARPLSGVVEERLVCRNYADGGSTSLYALRENGRVYAWRASDSAYQIFLVIICPALGAPLGMLAGLIVGLLRRRTESPGSIINP